MRDEIEIRDELARMIVHYSRIESKDSQHARDAYERIRALTWVLENTETDSMAPGGNGTPEAE